MKTTGLNLDLAAGIGDSNSSIKADAKTSDAKTAFSSVMNLAQNLGSRNKQSEQTDAYFKITAPSKGGTIRPNSNVANSSVADKKASTSVKDSSEDPSTELREKIKKLLDVSDEEFNELLETLGLTAMDLFQPENLTKLILEHFDAESTADALVDEGLSNALLASSDLLADIMPEDGQGAVAIEQPLEVAEDITATEGKEIPVEVQKETENSRESSDGKEDRNLKKESKETFVEYFTDKVDLTSIQSQGTSLYEAKQIVSQLVDQIRVTLSQSKTSMEVILNPEALGKVQVTVQSKAGVLTAHLNCENEVTKEALESSLQVLKESFEAQGLKVEKVEITIGNNTLEYSEQENKENEQGNSNSNKKINIDDYLEADGEFEEKANNAPIASLNGTIEYMA